MECQECFVFQMDQKRELRLDQLEQAQSGWTIRAYEERGMEETQHFLLHMPDRTARQTHCVMPQTNEKPTSWNEIKDGKFWIINGQHSVAVSKSIQTMDIPESVQTAFKTWNCFIRFVQKQGEAPEDLGLLQSGEPF